MSYNHESPPWPSTAHSSSSADSGYFPTPDREPLTASMNSVYPHSSIHINPGSELPRQPSSPLSPPLQTRPRKDKSLTGSSPGNRSSSIPLTSSSRVIKSTPIISVRPEEVWKEIFKTAYGRDKAFKIIQYTMRVLLLVHKRTVFLLKRPIGDELVGRLNVTIKHFSITRKCLILFNWLTPLIQITSPSESSVPFASSAAGLSSPTLLHRFLHAPPPVLLDLFNSVFDDVSTLSKLGLVGTAIGRRAGRLADWMWFASTLAGLVEVGAERSMVKGMLNELEGRIYEAETEKTGDLSRVEEDEEELKKLRSQFGWLQLSRVKLLLDLIFVSYDVFKLQRAREPVQTIAGLSSALLSSYKMYDSQRSEVFKSMS